MTARLRPYDPGDLEQVLDVWERASHVGHHVLSAAFLDEERGLLATRWLPASDTTVAVLDDAVVGFASVAGDELGGLFVDPQVHRRGVATQLLAHVRTGRDHLEVGVLEENPGARAFYEAGGFVLVGPSPELVDGHRELRMRWTAG